MVSFRKMSSRLLVISVLRKVPYMVGCLLFLFSLISPFYLTEGILAPISNYYWSYRHDSYGMNPLHHYPNQYWFSNYWFTLWSNLPWVLLLMFIIQVLTLFLGVASVIFSRRILSFVPVLSCLGVLGLMVYAGQILNTGLGGYQLGYYLVYPSVGIFLFAFLLNEATKKGQTNGRDTSIPLIDTEYPQRE